MPDLAYNAGALLVTLLAALLGTLPERRARVALAAALALLLASLGAGAFALASWAELGGFAALRFLAWGVFLHAPLALLLAALLLQKRNRRVALEAAGAALCVALVAGWAFEVEPRWLEVTHHEIESARIERAIRIAVLSDLQTDEIGVYERRVLEALRDARADLVLLTGDYLQVRGSRVPSADELAGLQDELAALWAEVGVHARLGVHAVGGDVEPVGWQRSFAGSDVRCHPDTVELDLGELRLTALDVVDSCRVDLTLPDTDAFHVVFGHRPDFALSPLAVDLLIAGHTHGGQVRAPFLGPLLTLSRVPRAWAAGLTRIGPERWLCVSRGVGLERGQAPPLRFLCRPELVVIDVVPPGSGARASGSGEPGP